MGNIIAFNPCSFCEKKDMCTMCELAMRRSGSIPSNKWIGVEERLPEETCECLAVSKFGTISLVNYSNRYKAFNATDDYDDGDRWKFSDVTYWMPLPDAPKGGVE